jgi:membrane protein YdbS with pleckstrin-like domain
MNGKVEQLTAWVYEGVWGILARWFRVPREPPQLPVRPGEVAVSFRPAPGFLRYLKLFFWIALVPFDGLVLLGWLGLTVALPQVGILLLPLALAIAVLPDVAVYVAIHLRYDTTWYVMTERSLRIRRGIWILHETTITFENVQNVAVNQGPIQRLFGIADVLVETAGGGSAQAEAGAKLSGHRGLIEGVANAHQIRDLLMKRLRRSRSAGLGDEPTETMPNPPVGLTQHVAVLGEIRDALAELASRTGQ